MAHSVEVNVTGHPLGREELGIVFIVTDDDGRFGELTISKGGVCWRPRGKHQRHFTTWPELDLIPEIMVCALNEHQRLEDRTQRCNGRS